MTGVLKGCGIGVMVHIKDHLLLIEKRSPCSVSTAGFLSR